MTRRLLATAALLLLAACGSVNGSTPDAAPPPPPDARLPTPDAAPPPPPSPAREVLSGAGHVAGPTLRMDLTVGNAIEQKPMVGSSITAQGNSAVKP